MATEDAIRARWSQDSRVLEEIGRSLDGQELWLEVRLPRSLAQAALDAWRRDEADEDVTFTTDSPQERRERHRAGTLGLIGNEIQHQGLSEGDPVVVKLQAHNIGAALQAAWNDD